MVNYGMLYNKCESFTDFVKLIDTLNISYIHNCEKKEFLSNLEKVTTVNYYNGTSSYSCKYKDYSITIGDTRIKLKGSIAKQHYGNNFNTTTRPEFIETIGELSHRLKIDVGKFKLSIARIRASVPLFVAIQYFAFTNFLNLFSKSIMY